MNPNQELETNEMPAEPKHVYGGVESVSLHRIACFAGFVFIGIMGGFWFASEFVFLNPIFEGHGKGPVAVACLMSLVGGGIIGAISAHRFSKSQTKIRHSARQA